MSLFLVMVHMFLFAVKPLMIFIKFLIFQEAHLLNWNNLGFLIYPYIFFLKNHVKI